MPRYQSQKRVKVTPLEERQRLEALFDEKILPHFEGEPEPARTTSGGREYVFKSHRFNARLSVTLYAHTKANENHNPWLACRFDRSPEEVPSTNPPGYRGLPQPYTDIDRELRQIGLRVNVHSGKCNHYALEAMTADEIIEQWHYHLRSALDDPTGREQIPANIFEPAREAEKREI